MCVGGGYLFTFGLILRPASPHYTGFSNGIIYDANGNATAATVQSTSQHFLLQKQRIAYAVEFVRSLKNDAVVRHRFGVLFSGPNGVGKSAIGLLAFLSSYAQRQLVVYIPDANAWVLEALAGRGDVFFLKTLWKQNADLVAASDVLRPLFAAAMCDEDLESSVMGRLRDLLESRPGPSIGVIVDESQKLTEAIARGTEALSIPSERAAASYFSVGWQNWTNANKCFVRLNVASSHAERDLSLPSGEEHRLRVVFPWSAEDVTALASDANSPFQIPVVAERQRIQHISGGIIRVLLRGQELLKSRSIAIVEDILRSDMAIGCSLWMEKDILPPQRQNAYRLILSLVRGQVSWIAVKGLYDRGLVARFDESRAVRAVSAVAASVMLEVFARLEHYEGRQLLSTFEGGAPRGVELERQFISALCADGRCVIASKWDGSSAARVSTFNDTPCVFSTIDDVVVRQGQRVLYVPLDDQFPCDAISVPSDPLLPIQLFEVSVTDPRDNKCIGKVTKWFANGALEKWSLDKTSSFFAQLQMRHPGRSFQIVLVFNGELGNGRAFSSYANLDAVANNAQTSAAVAATDDSSCSSNSESVRPGVFSIIERAGLAELGVM